MRIHMTLAEVKQHSHDFIEAVEKLGYDAYVLRSADLESIKVEMTVQQADNFGILSSILGADDNDGS